LSQTQLSANFPASMLSVEPRWVESFILTSAMQPLIFESVWQDLEAEYGRANLRFPKELILLGGAPGAGKGTNTAFISRARGLTCPPIVISNLLDSPGGRATKDSGQRVGERAGVSPPRVA